MSSFQQAQQAKPGSESNEGFVPVQGAEREQVSAASSVIAAYLLIWLVVIGFIFLTWNKLGRLKLNAERLQDALGKPTK